MKKGLTSIRLVFFVFFVFFVPSGSLARYLFRSAASGALEWNGMGWNIGVVEPCLLAVLASDTRSPLRSLPRPSPLSLSLLPPCPRRGHVLPQFDYDNGVGSRVDRFKIDLYTPGGNSGGDCGTWVTNLCDKESIGCKDSSKSWPCCFLFFFLICRVHDLGNYYCAVPITKSDVCYSM